MTVEPRSGAGINLSVSRWGMTISRRPNNRASSENAPGPMSSTAAAMTIRRLTMPILAIGGEASYGEHVGGAMKLLADEMQSVVISGTGHWVAEEAPDEMLAALTVFLTPGRGASTRSL